MFINKTGMFNRIKKDPRRRGKSSPSTPPPYTRFPVDIKVAQTELPIWKSWIRAWSDVLSLLITHFLCDVEDIDGTMVYHKIMYSKQLAHYMKSKVMSCLQCIVEWYTPHSQSIKQNDIKPCRAVHTEIYHKEFSM